jgi:phosphoadenosine phosphosulfate reductase
MVWLDFQTRALVAEPQLDITIQIDSDDEALKAAATKATQSGGIIGIPFEKYKDGRGFTLARILREEFGFQGEIIAFGHVVPDQAQFLLRTGFTKAEIGDEARFEAWLVALSRFQLHYQPTALHQGLGRKAYIDQRVENLNTQLSGAQNLQERLAIIKDYAKATYGHIAFSTSLQKEDQAITHALFSGLFGKDDAGDIKIFTLDTLRLFDDVIATIEATEKQYGITIKRITPDQAELAELVAQNGENGFYESVENRKACCFTRKVRPLSKALEPATLWITGLRRGQSDNRKDIALAKWDHDHGVMKINPVIDWSDEFLEAYLADNAIPVNPMHERGFPSIGCEPCTRAIKPGEDIRAGRWWWEQKDDSQKECGLHVATDQPSHSDQPLKGATA